MSEYHINIIDESPKVTIAAHGPMGPRGLQGVPGPQGPQSTVPGPKGDKGEPGNPSAYELRGTGMPNGVLSAPAGTYYTDTAGTNGAWRWIKTTATGSIGWTVVIGDTGWRSIQGELVSGWTGTVWTAVRRINNTVYLRVRSLSGASATSNQFWTAPTGFRPTVASGGAVFSGNSVWLLSVNTVGGATLSGNSSSYTGFVGNLCEASYAVTEAWPVLVPGQPV